MNARLSYREAAVPGASPLRLVILLYEQAVEDLRCAREAHRRHDIEGRTRRINHAILVIGHLQASLDKDQGGRVAANLERFYDQLRSRLVAAQCNQSAVALEQLISHLVLVQQAWCETETRETEKRETEKRAAQGANATSANASRAAQSQEEHEGQGQEGQELRSSAGWNA